MSNNRTLHVTNIPSELTEDLLKVFFDEIGTITNLKMLGDPQSRYAFIEFATPEQAKVGLDLNGVEIIDGKPLKISMSRTSISSGHHHHTTPHQHTTNHTTINPTINNNTTTALNNTTTISNNTSNSLIQTSTSGVAPPSSPVLFSENDYKKRLEEEEKITRTIYVTSIDTQITEPQVCEFFSYCGRITNYRVCGDTQHPTRFAFFEFEQKESALAAISLSGQFLGRYALRILSSRTPIQPTPGASGNGATYSFTPAHHDQIGRTVYVGNVDVSLTEDDLKEFFDANCGPVTKVVLAGDVIHSARFAFVEFLHLESRNKALECSGTLLGNRNIRINPSRTPILGGGKAYASTAPSINPATGTSQYAVNHLSQSRAFPPVAPLSDPYYHGSVVVGSSVGSSVGNVVNSKKSSPIIGKTALPGGNIKGTGNVVSSSSSSLNNNVYNNGSGGEEMNEKKRKKNDWSDESEDEGEHQENEQKKHKLLYGNDNSTTTIESFNVQQDNDNIHHQDILNNSVESIDQQHHEHSYLGGEE
ncbi:hypothetical protein ABK040_004197 [Willaertia magna]